MRAHKAGHSRIAARLTLGGAARRFRPWRGWSIGRYGLMYMSRPKLLVLAAALILTVGAGVGVWLLQHRSDTSRQAQLAVSAITLSLDDLQSAPFSAVPAAGVPASVVSAMIRADERSILRGLTPRSQAGVPRGLLAAGRLQLASIEPVVSDIYRLALGPGSLAAAGLRVPPLQARLIARSAVLAAMLGRVSRTDAARAALAGTQATFGAAGAMLLLLLAFAYFYLRSVAARGVVARMGREREELLGVARLEARTDSLTHLGNRRALTSELTRALADPSADAELLLAMFDLDGFKQYNDTFGHAAGDALLGRVGARIATTIADYGGSAYRMGGDEFCIVARCHSDAAERLLNDTVAALTETGESWHVGCSHGAAWLPSEAATDSQALKLADERMYTNKVSRSSASRQVADALLQVITEQSVLLDEHVERVCDQAGALAVILGQSASEVLRIRMAARLHDIGKTAIPAAILDKPGPLSEQECQFIRRHPLIGQRIVMAAPALANTAELIRSSHERIDGQGYPDGLRGQDIPLGSRIIAVCDAFDAMTSERPYRPTKTVDAALEELSRGAGTQFDAAIVETFSATLSAHNVPAA
jgi:diguanylate cyclase (GGDEF)-like protein